MEVDSFLVNGLEDAVTNFGTVKEMVLKQLLKDKVIDEKQFDTYNSEWQLVVLKKSWYKRWFNKYPTTEGKGKVEYFMKLVKFDKNI